MTCRLNDALKSSRPRPGTAALFLLLAWLIGVPLGGCGYGAGASPYQLAGPLAVSVPMARNKTTNSALAAILTNLMIETLAASPQITIVNAAAGQPEAPAAGNRAVLELAISNWKIEGGAWELESGDQAFSVSRRVYLTVEGVLTHQGPQGRVRPPVRRSVITSRTYQVTSDQTQLETNQAYAVELALAEAARKLALAIFSDF